MGKGPTSVRPLIANATETAMRWPSITKKKRGATSRLHSSDQGRSFPALHLSDRPASRYCGCFPGKSRHPLGASKTMLLTHTGHRRSRFAVLHNIITSRKVYSTTSSAATSSVCGIVRPSSFAVLRLMTNSNLVGCSTGRSLGLAPRKILSTYSAARWNRVGMLGP